MYRNTKFNQSDNSYYSSKRDLNIILKILSFTIPLLGFLLYAKKRNTEPEAAKSACEMAIAGFFFGIFLNFLFYAYNNR